MPPGAPLPSPLFYGVIPPLRGYAGHHDIALEHLEEFLEDLRLSDPTPVRLIVTGDVTRNGHASQFNMAGEYLGGRLPPARASMGLEVRDWRDLTIPGNHDHWPGKDNSLGVPACNLNSVLNPTPETVMVPGPGGNPDILFIRVNSDADVPARSPSRFFANGEFTSQLWHLDTILPTPPTDNEIRVLLLHHSPGYVSSKTPAQLSIEPSCRRDLESFIVRHKIRVVMCGHVHEHTVGILPVTWNDQTVEVLEARCGSTTQLDRHPLLWPVLWPFGAPPPDHVNSLLVHRLWKHGTAHEWEVSVHRRTTTGFLTEPDSSIVMPL
ncbi:hypothetical protein [Azospirillum argentinense]